MNNSFPCGICSKTAAKNHNVVCCNKCDMWVHIKCNNITKLCYKKLQKDNEPWYYKACLSQVFPFSGLPDYQTNQCMSE